MVGNPDNRRLSLWRTVSIAGVEETVLGTENICYLEEQSFSSRRCGPAACLETFSQTEVKKYPE